MKILIVPGHDDVFSGASFGNTREADLNVELANNIYDFLFTNPNVLVHMSRTERGYSRDFLNYLDEERLAINEYVNLYKTATAELFQEGVIKVVKYMEHNNAPSEVAFKLFGLNKYASENDYDLVIHVHFNDHPGRTKTGGKYSGFSIYAPDTQFRNGKASQEIAEKIKDRLDNFYPASNHPNEYLTVIPSQELIAIGSHNTLSSASVLIEYGYIYEPQFHNPAIKPIILKDMALQTYLGILDFVEDKKLADKTDRSVLVQSGLSKELGKSENFDSEVLILQTILRENGFYPPNNKTLNECSITGKYGPCTELAVKNFQSKNNIEPTGIVGQSTKQKINDLVNTIRF